MWTLWTLPISWAVVCSLFSTKGAQRSGWAKNNGHSVLTICVKKMKWLPDGMQGPLKSIQIHRFFKRSIGPWMHTRNNDQCSVIKTLNSHIDDPWPTFYWFIMEWMWVLNPYILHCLNEDTPLISPKRDWWNLGRKILYKRYKLFKL